MKKKIIQISVDQDNEPNNERKELNHDDNLLNPESESVMAQIQSIMEHMLAMIHSGSNNDGTTFDPDMDENMFYNEWDRDEIVGGLITADYEQIDYKNEGHFQPIHEYYWEGATCTIPHNKRMELESEYFYQEWQQHLLGASNGTHPPTL